MRTQMERDLANNASDRLKLWVKDTLMRCDIAGLDHSQEAAIITSVLLEELLHVFHAIGMKPNDGAILIQEGLTILYKASGKKDETSGLRH